MVKCHTGGKWVKSPHHTGTLQLWHTKYIPRLTVDLTEAGELTDPEEWILVTRQRKEEVCLLCQSSVGQKHLLAHISVHLLEVLEMMKRRDL